MLMDPFVIDAPEGRVTILLEIYEEDGRLIAALRGCDGRLNTKQPGWFKAIRRELHTIETIVRSANCSELRIGGRDWSRILIDYDRLDGVPNGLRKVLAWAT